MCPTSRACSSDAVRAHSLSRVKGEDSRAVESCSVGQFCGGLCWHRFTTVKRSEAGLQELSVFGSASTVGLFYDKTVCH